MRAVILAGGMGTRLRPYTTIIPKPLVPVGDRPILEHIISRLVHTGVRKVDLCVSHLGELIQLYFSQEGILPEGVELAWHWEDEPLGTAGALTTVPDLDDTFIAMNGDILTSLDYDVSMGIYVYEPRALAHLPQGPCQFPDLVLRLLDAGEHVAAYKTDAEWYDIGTIGEYERAVQDTKLFDHDVVPPRRILVRSRAR